MHIHSLHIERDKFPRRDRYPFQVPAIIGTDELHFSDRVTFFIGENGSGKSTLLRAMASRCGIYQWRGIDRPRADGNPYTDQLYRYIRIKWSDGIVPGAFFGSDTFANFARILDEWATMDPDILDYYGGQSLAAQSHGQCNMAYFQNRFSRPGVYLLDEPETALSPKTQLELLHLLTELRDDERVQFFIATHSPLLLSLKDAHILRFGDEAIEPVAYKDTDYYRVYADFFGSMQMS